MKHRTTQLLGILRHPLMKRIERYASLAYWVPAACVVILFVISKIF
jgi:hypothetical protein